MRDVFPSPVPPTIATKLPTGIFRLILVRVGFSVWTNRNLRPPKGNENKQTPERKPWQLKEMMSSKRKMRAMEVEEILPDL